MFRTIDTALWTDAKVRALHPDAKLLFLYLITNTHTHVGGIYYLPDVVVAHETGLPLARIAELWDTLSIGYPGLDGVGLVRRDSENEVVWVVNMLRFQGRGPKVVRCVANHIKTLHKSVLIKEFLASYPDVKKALGRYPIDRVSSAGSSWPIGTGTGTGTGEESFAGKPAGEEAKEPTKAPRPRNPVFDAIVEITGFDPSVKTNGSLIGKAVAALANAKPPYTAEEVRLLPAAVEAAGLSITLTPSAIEKYIGWVRKLPTRTAANGTGHKMSPAEFFSKGGDL